MRILLRLYPKAWRDLYGDEFAGILAAQRLSPRLLMDIIGGAVDARLQPQVRTNKGDVMTMGFLKRCAVGGPQLSKKEERLGAAAMIGFSLLFAGLYTWASYVYRGNEMVDAFGAMAFPAAVVATMPFTYLKGQSRAARLLTVGGLLGFLAAVAYLATLI
ncbi:MAG TPA: hypothetical protein VMZ90_08915 [Vicinamibacterales bacterium]|nr:hypothetical protein [Vicinamibacterales bacterium]